MAAPAEMPDQKPSAPDDADERSDGPVQPPPPEEREDAPGEDKGDDARDGETTPTTRTETGTGEPTDDSGACLIATVAYGTELALHVQMLREVGETTLGSTAAGTSFMAWFNDAYYAFSPAVADLEREHPRSGRPSQWRLPRCSTRRRSSR